MVADLALQIAVLLLIGGEGVFVGLELRFVGMEFLLNLGDVLG